MSGYFLSSADLPLGFTYPAQFHRVVDLELVNWHPWQLLSGDLLNERFVGIGSRYPDRVLLAFARRMDRDDIACWDLDADPGAVSIIDDFAEAGFEQIQTLGSFEDWLRLAFEAMVVWED